MATSFSGYELKQNNINTKEQNFYASSYQREQIQNNSFYSPSSKGDPQAFGLKKSQTSFFNPQNSDTKFLNSSQISSNQREGSISRKGETFQQKNQELITKLAEKNKQEAEERERQEKKQKKREKKLKARILAEVTQSRVDGVKESQININENNQQQRIQWNTMNIQNRSVQSAVFSTKSKRSISLTGQAKENNFIEGEKQSVKSKEKKLKFKDVQQMYDLVVVRGKYSRKQLSDKQKLQLAKLEEKINQEKEELMKIQSACKSRQLAFLDDLKKKQERKKQDEEDYKQKLEKIQNKMKEQYDFITSNIFADTTQSKLKKVETQDNKASISKLKRATSAEQYENKEQRKETIQRLTQKNYDYIEKLKEKVQLDNSKEEEEEEIKKKKKQVAKEKAKERDMILIKNYNENEPELTDSPFKKPKKEKKKEDFSLTQVGSPKIETPQTIQKKIQKLPKIKDVKESKNQNKEEDYEEEDHNGLESESDEEVEIGSVKRKLRKYPFIVDLDLWKKKQRLPADQKVFIVTGGYPEIKKSLRKRGWVGNPDTNSPCYNFRWSLQGRDIDYEGLKDFQIANHFQKSTHITTKSGLCKSIRNLIWHENEDINSFYPRSFDLNDIEDFTYFVEEFKANKAESILKRYMRMYFEKDPEIQKIKKQALIALNVCSRKIRDLDEIIDDPTSTHLITKKEWEILSSDEISEEKLAQKKYEQWLERIEGKKKPEVKKKKKKKQIKPDTPDTIKEEGGEEDDEEEDDIMDEFTLQVSNILNKFKLKYSQDILNGEDNIWILKPAGLSRGRGITCYNNLVEILDHIKSKESQWVIQKYIENPLIIKKRKFDIRVWVLVTDWNPLTIWYFEDCYVRFSVDDYDTANLQNKFTHLTNNMISKLKQREEKDDISDLGNMYFKENLIEFLEEKEGYDVFTEKIEPSLKHAIIMSLKSVQDTIENRKGNHEMYGYDFMVDDLYNTWLIEINSSPSMEYSTPVTERLVKAVSEDIVKVVIDYGMEKSKKAKKNVDTGAFQRIYKGKYVEEKTGVVGINLICEGTALKKRGGQQK